MSIETELAMSIGQLADSTNKAITILAKAILQMDENHLTPAVRNAVKALSETEEKA